MSDELVDTLISEAVTETPETTVNEASETVEQPQTQSEPQATDKASDDVPFPKKAINAISRRDKQIGKLRAEHQAAVAELNRLREQYESKQSPQNSNVPQEDQFETYGDYLKAVARHEARNELAETNLKSQQDLVAQKEQAWVAERETHIATQAQEAITSIPDFQQVLAEYADVVDDFPAHIERAFLEADNAPLAFYTLAKEGKLETLASLSPIQAAMEIGRAQDRAASLTKPKPQITQAPAPMESVKGSGPVSKSPDRMSADELLKWVNS